MAQVDVQLNNVVKLFPTRRKDSAVRAVDNISLEIYAGEFFALLGPSGCGKTTTLRMIAGFEEPTSGEILIRGQAVQGVPPFHRPVNTVFQDYALFPHMTVLQNVMFGLEMEGVGKSAARQRAHEALELVHLPEAADRKPRQLSGGQQQRVALARALVKKPAVLLLDEPLGALDLKLRKAMQVELKAMQQQVGITFIYVTHDQEEAMTMADRIAVIHAGRVLQVGEPEVVYETPATRFVADFIGETNFISGALVEASSGRCAVRLANGAVIQALSPAEPTARGSEVTIPLRPERIGLLPCSANGDSEAIADMQRDERMTVLEGTVKERQYIGTDMRYTVDLAGAVEIVVRIQNMGYGDGLRFEQGQCVHVFWSHEHTGILVE